MLTVKERYEERRRQWMAHLARAFGQGATIPLSVAAAGLPVLPEWETPVPQRRSTRPDLRGGKGGGK